MSELSNRVRGLILAFEVSIEDDDPKTQRRQLERDIASLEAKLGAMERAGMALIAGCEAPDWISWHKAVIEWRALVAAAQEERE